MDPAVLIHPGEVSGAKRTIWHEYVFVIFFGEISDHYGGAPHHELPLETGGQFGAGLRVDRPHFHV